MALHTFCYGQTISSGCLSVANLCVCVCVCVRVCVCMHCTDAYMGFMCLKGAARSLQIRMSEALWRQLIREPQKGSDTTGGQIMHNYYASISVEKHPWNRIWTLACRAALELEISQWTMLSWGSQTCLKGDTKHLLKGWVNAVCSDDKSTGCCWRSFSQYHLIKELL